MSTTIDDAIMQRIAYLQDQLAGEDDSLSLYPNISNTNQDTANFILLAAKTLKASFKSFRFDVCELLKNEMDIYNIFSQIMHSKRSSYQTRKPVA